jgi:hypothetical protein
MRGAPNGSDLEALRAALYAHLRREPESRDAHLRLYEVEQMLGRPTAAVAHLARAVRDDRVIVSEARETPARVRVLALYRIAPWEANLPLELVIDERHATLQRFYLADEDDERILSVPLPPHDVLINAIAWSKRALPTLRLAEQVAERSNVAVVNRPSVIADLGRDRVAERFADSCLVLAPPTQMYAAADVPNAPLSYPAIIRPISSQAGIDLAKVDDPVELAGYLAEHPHKFYFISPFVDYRGADGYFRKYRIVFVDGVPYAYHLAISPHWMIHYYNAPMAEHAWMRAEEAAFCADLASVFCGALADGLREIAMRIPLEYFAIDCALAPDGRVLLFEADGAMLVHGSDDPELFGYKRAAFERVQAAFARALEGRVARA